MQEQVVLDKKTIADYLKDAGKQEPEMMIDLLVDKVYVHEDRIELILNYTGTPPKPKRRIDDKPENPEGESLRGSLIFTTEASVDIYSYQGIKKNRPEPKFKGVCKKSVLIEI